MVRSLPLSLWIAAVACVLALTTGWALRAENLVSPRSGAGYALGVVGLGMMVLLLLYSVRKHVRALSRWGPIRRWFHAHMVLGLLGPTAVLLHCNFELGSVNSSVVLFCTLFVAGSGIVGRIVYTRVHEELTGRRRSLAELRGELEAARRELAAEARGDVLERLDEIERYVDRRPEGALAALGQFVAVGARVRRASRACRRVLGARDRSALAPVSAYLASARRVARFGVYERLFALWHAVHLPLCFLLFASAGIHVFAVHSY
ncbi:MAG: hypothetical protein ACQGVC_02980 [Myxococcota bacterium]